MKKLLDLICNIGKACTFSEMDLHITDNGEKVTNTTVTRSIEWDKEITDSFQTDEFGKVRIPSTFQRSMRQFFPIPLQFMAVQLVTVSYKNEDYEIWAYAKMNPEEFREFNGKPLTVTCDLTDPEIIKNVNGRSVYTKCRWDTDDR